MRQSGGTMKIQSEPGHGTAIDLYMPITIAAASNSAIRASA
jgi:chemotaxis protein histidine kinase CheA